MITCLLIVKGHTCTSQHSVEMRSSSEDQTRALSSLWREAVQESDRMHEVDMG